MGCETVRIDELRLRVPGLSEPEARRLGEDVARRVADGLAAHGRVEHLGLLDLRISMPSGVSKERLAERIAEEILKKLP
jgi:hypothetical protein